MNVTDCTLCPLHISRTMIVNAILPKGGCDVAIVSGAPNRTEDYNGRLNVGKPKKKLAEMLLNVGADLTRVAYIPLVRCRGKNDRQPTEEEVLACRPYLLADLKEIAPPLVVTLGVSAYEALAHEEGTLTARRADVQLPFEDSDAPYPVLGTFSPGITFREWDKQELIEGDLDKALTYVREKPCVTLGTYQTITDPIIAKNVFEYLKTCEWVSFDFETESLGMWSDWEILTMQVCGKAGEAFTFPLRGAWSRHEVDYYPDWQQAKGEWSWTKAKKGDDPALFMSQRVLRKSATKSHSPMKPAFPAGSIICRYPERHDPDGEQHEAQHTCRGTVTDILAGELTEYTGPGLMKGKMVPSDWIIMRDLFADFLQHMGKKFGQNIKFDVHAAIYQLGVRPRNVAFDTMLAYHLIHEEFFANNGLDLDAIRARLLFMPRYNLELKEYVPGRKHSYAEIPNDVLHSYGGADADTEFQLREPLIAAIERDNPEHGMWLLENIALPLQRTLTQIEQRGILINRDRLNELSEFYRQKIADTKHQLDVMAMEHKLTPPQKWTNERQLRSFIFEKKYEWVVKKESKTKPAVTTPMRGLGLPKSVGVLSKKTGVLSTGKASVKALQAYCRETVVYRSTPDRINPLKIWRNPTDEPLTVTTRANRAWRGEMVGLIGKLRSCVNQKNLFLDGDDDKKILGAKALLRHIREDGRIHPSYRQTLETARLSSNDPNCLTGDHEVLTPEGWVRLDALDDVTDVAQYWPTSGTISFARPSSVTRAAYGGPILTFQNQHIDLAMTPNHRCLLRHRKTGELRVFRADEYPEDWQQLCAGTYEMGDQLMSRELLSLIIAVQGDGSYVPHGGIRFGLKKPRKVERLRELLRHLAAPYTERVYTNGVTVFYLNVSDTTRAVREILGDTKRFGSWLLRLPPQLMDVFCEEVFFWDGHWRLRNCYASAHYENTSWVQTILTLRGNRVKIRKYVSSRGSVSWQTDVTRRDYSMTTNVERDCSSASSVYCVTLPSEFFLVRHNNVVMVTGNSQNISNTSEDPEFTNMGIRSMFCVEEGYDWTAVDYSSEEVRVIAYLANDVELLEKLHSCTCGEVFLPTEDDPDRPLKMRNHCVEGHDPVDIHRYVGSRVYKKAEIDVTKGERTAVKRVTFGLAYGQGPTGLADVLGWEVQAAKDLIEEYFKTFPSLPEYQENINILVRRGYDIPNAFGRFRHTNGVVEMRGYTEDALYRAKLAGAQRERLNFTVQSPAAEILSLCTIALGDVWGVEDGQLSEAHHIGHKLLGYYPSTRLHELDAHIIASNHDALEFESPTIHRAEVAHIIETIMVGVPWELLGWYLPVDMQHGAFWEHKEDDDV